MLDAAPTILSAFPDALRKRATRDLQALGVEIHLGTAVTHVDERGLETNSSGPRLRRIEAASKIWAAGVQASPLGRLLADRTGAEIDRAGRVKVEADLTLPGHPEIFVVGDLMSLDRLPGVSQVAIQSGRHAAQHHHRPACGRLDPSAVPVPRSRVDGDDLPLPRARPDRPVAGRRLHSVADVAGGAPRVLDGVQEPPLCLFNWTIAFLGRGRAERVITAQQVFARRALQQQPEVIPTVRAVGEELIRRK